MPFDAFFLRTDGRGGGVEEVIIFPIFAARFESSFLCFVNNITSLSCLFLVVDESAGGTFRFVPIFEMVLCICAEFASEGELCTCATAEGEVASDKHAP